MLCSGKTLIICFNISYDLEFLSVPVILILLVSLLVILELIRPLSAHFLPINASFLADFTVLIFEKYLVIKTSAKLQN